MYGILAAVVVGMVLGYVLGRQVTVQYELLPSGAQREHVEGPAWATATFGALAWLGDLFLRALKMVIVPLILFTIMAGVGSLGDITRLGRTGLHTLIYYFTTTGMAVLLGILLVNAVRPGVGVDLGGGSAPAEAAPTAAEVVRRIVEEMIPSNMLAAAVSDPPQVLSLITVALVFGALLTTLGERGARVLEIVDTLSEATLKLVNL
ncbi:MAG: dicarboxylate/amino acid:cation symporter, partial [Pirellulales bacterium]